VSLFRPELVASDLDGTLLPPTLEIEPRTLTGVTRLRAGGIPFVICTGRMFRSARRVAAQFGLADGLIVCYQGALVADLGSGEWLEHVTIDPPLAAEVVRHAREIDIHVNAYVDDELSVEQDDAWARRYAEYAEVGMTVVDDLLAVVAAPPTKFVLCAEPDRVDALLPVLQELWDARLYVTRSLPHYIEICNVAATKSAALEFLCRRLGASRKRTVACGDGLNDIDMIAWAGLGVAMSEAAVAVREAAGLVVEREALGDLFCRLADAPDDQGFAGFHSVPESR
jgi:Cof subfamily protein (haloacid dehalogenase superfamily)